LTFDGLGVGPDGPGGWGGAKGTGRWAWSETPARGKVFRVSG